MKNTTTDKCYFLGSLSKPWFQAREDCLNRDGDLVKMSSIEDWATVKSYTGLVSSRLGHYWIGVTRKDIRWQNGEFDLIIIIIEDINLNVCMYVY